MHQRDRLKHYLTPQALATLKMIDAGERVNPAIIGARPFRTSRSGGGFYFLFPINLFY
jgi:hypothetical protein